MNKITVDFSRVGLIKWMLSALLLLSVFSFSGCNSRTSFHQQTAKTEAINYKELSGTRKMFYKRSLADLREHERTLNRLQGLQANALAYQNELVKVVLQKASPIQLHLIQVPATQHKTIPQATDEPLFLSPAV